MCNSTYLGYQELAGDDFKYNTPNFNFLLCFKINRKQKKTLPFQQTEPGGVRTWKTYLCPSQSPSHHGLHQIQHRLGHLKSEACFNNISDFIERFRVEKLTISMDKYRSTVNKDKMLILTKILRENKLKLIIFLPPNQQFFSLNDEKSP